jgi:hypothetical protein
MSGEEEWRPLCGPVLPRTGGPFDPVFDVGRPDGTIDGVEILARQAGPERVNALLTLHPSGLVWRAARRAPAPSGALCGDPFAAELVAFEAGTQLDEALAGLKRIAEAAGIFQATWQATSITGVCDMIAAWCAERQAALGSLREAIRSELGPDHAARRHLLAVLDAAPDPPAAELHPCAKPDCGRLVAAPSLFCCMPCAQASARGHEIHAHSPGCDQRAATRTAVRDD